MKIGWTLGAIALVVLGAGIGLWTWSRGSAVPSTVDAGASSGGRAKNDGPAQTVPPIPPAPDREVVEAPISRAAPDLLAIVAEWATQRLHERTGRFTSRHYQSGILFDELTSDSALTRTMVLVTHQGVAEAAPRPTISGVCHDQWRKTHTGWRLAHQAAHVDGDPGFSK